MFFSARISLRVDALSPERRREVVEAAWSQSRRAARSRLGAARRSLWPVVQTACAAAIAWVIATRALGHDVPFFGPAAAALPSFPRGAGLRAPGAARARPPRRAVEMMLGVALGVGLADLLVHLLG